MKKKHLRVIREIQDRIPRELLMTLTNKELVSPTVKKVFELALTKPDSEVAPRQKRAIKAMIDSGRLDREVEVIDKAVETEIDHFISEEIAKAVKLGRLPQEAPKLKTLKKKGNQYARRQEKRLRTEFGVEANDVANDQKNDQNHEPQHPPREGYNSFVSTPRAASR